MPNALTRSVI